ncbi:MULTISPECIES: RraA family protein [unclassified Pseudomonas]|uniref:RraA family protein n=1 Tax=unclassified Pseudomonas TaxID=196821 RepID=UPI000BC3CDB0|nr:MULTISPECIES: RraA family protein [unclassified Pseudomonas]PVZ10552.1 RraA family protein [Pseudomonas sp. URIL14HWK12:I12]PVZ21978.1 RraA family protein [Pseudomonas sp. URIL14HWK12:I10]PVZ30939.1 RraA family protein [Pseudomonas sp. URIL14HWK12:I11]SNZ17350.1 RraA famliy [Pseudomonas sp. URIL14HWK12:I9]
MNAIAPSPELRALVQAYTQTSTSIISDCLDRLPGARLSPFHRIEGTMAGLALTVKVPCGDNRAIHQALELLSPGQVLVVDGGGDLSRALMGDIMAAIAEKRGAAGVVVDGAIRDLATIGQHHFPVFARAGFHRGPYKNGPGEINVPVSIAGMLVAPGDIVVADHDGVVAFPAAQAAELLQRCHATERKEAEMLAQIAAGTYKGAYAAH